MKESLLFLCLVCCLPPYRCRASDIANDYNLCGPGTFDYDTNRCLCNHDAVCVGEEEEAFLIASSTTIPPTTTSTVDIAGIFDTSTFEWGREIFDFTVKLINDHNDGWHDDIFNDGTILHWTLADSACDATTAARAYWGIRSKSGIPPHGVVGCRCSGASTSVARIAGLEGVPQISMSSTSTQLSDKNEFPFFSRTVAPDDQRGQVGALVSMLTFFGWQRVSIIYTDTQFSKDLSTLFRSIWKGEVAYTGTVLLKTNADEVDVDDISVRHVLNDVPTNDPTINSRIILLFAHDRHAYDILETAHGRYFQPDTIWVGVDSWVNRLPSDFDSNRFMEGYIGITPYRNRNEYYDDFLTRFQMSQKARGKTVVEELPDHAAENMIDSIVALAKALSSVHPSSRRDGRIITERLRDLHLFDGVSGDLAFTEEGDRRDPLYTIFNIQRDQHGNLSWVDIGVTSTTEETSSLPNINNVCFPKVGCGRGEVPGDSYPIPRQKAPVWVRVVIPIIVILLVIFFAKYCRSRHKKNALKRKIEAMEKIDSELVSINDQVESAKRRQASLIAKRAQLQEMPDTWTDTDETLVEVPPEDEQYWAVSERLRETMNDAHISQLWRVQNKSLWTYYSFHKDRLSMTGIDHNEQSVWHGTSFLDPSVIYDDRQDGFMMQFSREGFWGRGIYFAAKSSYSHSYAYRPPQQQQNGSARPKGKKDEREMFLAKLLKGNEIFMDRDESDQKKAECRSLTVPPTDKTSNLKYNTVTGRTAGSQVWIVYENGRAYPDYLVRYYRGSRDSTRTPFRSRHEAGVAPSNDDIEVGSMNGDAVVWEYLDNHGWVSYSSVDQNKLETAYNEVFVLKTSQLTKVQIQAGGWTYEVDMEAMVQTNISHSGRRERDVRRRENVAVP